MNFDPLDADDASVALGHRVRVAELIMEAVERQFRIAQCCFDRSEVVRRRWPNRERGRHCATRARISLTHESTSTDGQKMVGASDCCLAATVFGWEAGDAASVIGQVGIRTAVDSFNIGQSSTGAVSGSRQAKARSTC